MSCHQVQDLKPSPIPPTFLPKSRSNSFVAVQGATSAFHPKASTPSLGVSPISAGARLAASAAGSHARQPASPHPTERKNGPRTTSPSRGRQLHSHAGLTPITGKLTASPITLSPPSRPPLQTRSSSTLAARHASAHSRSPQRSPQRSPHKGSITTSSFQEHEPVIQSTAALSGALASMLAKAGQEDGRIAPSLKNKNFSTERLSPISRSDTALQLPMAKSMRNGSEFVYQRGVSYIESQRSPIQVSSPRRPRTLSASRVQTVPVNGLRETPDDGITIPSIETTPIRSNASSRRERLLDRALGTGVQSFEPKDSPQSKAWMPDAHRSNMTVSSLADAMVASSLASSRAPSPSKKPSPPSLRRRSQSLASLYELRSTTDSSKPLRHSKTPRPMKHTLRKSPSSDEEEIALAKRGRRHWMRKHPNMHSEGDRKRWRDKVTEAERRRYEGVFAANRALLIGSGVFEASPRTVFDYTAEGNQVVNVVVRDVWERSRLPREVLEEIYDLVCPEEALTLDREQFVVGMWLIDQRLKGRKLPVKVSPSVWSSVRHSQGIKIRSKPM